MKRPGMLLTAAVAWVGVVAGHLVAYLLAYPSQGVRHVHLLVTGHSWLGLATASLLAVVPVILLAVAVRAIGPTNSWSGSKLAFRLTTIQVPAFALIELLERRGGLGRTVTDPAFFVGLVLLPLVAVLAAWILGLYRGAVRAFISRLRRRRAIAARSLPRPALKQLRSRDWLLLPARGRAPPRPSLS